MKNIILLSHIAGQDTPSYGNRDRVFIRANSSISAGDTANSSCWIFSNNHIGTHIDPPRHFSDSGKRTFDFAPADYIFSNVSLVDIPCDGPRLISPSDLEAQTGSIEENVELLLIRTGYEKLRKEDRYWNDNPGLAPELADFLRNRFPFLRCVGFDFISLTSWKHRPEGRLSHKAFLCPEDGARPILAIEDMSLEAVRGKLEEVTVAPFFMEDGNGGAVTVFAKLA